MEVQVIDGREFTYIARALEPRHWGYCGAMIFRAECSGGCPAKAHEMHLENIERF